MTKLPLIRERSVVRFSVTPVGEIILGGIVGEIGERQHDDGKMCGFRRRLRSGSHGPVRGEKPPCDAADQDQQCDDPGDQREERRTPFRRVRLRFDRGLCLRGDADLQRIDADRFFDVLELRRPKICDRHVEPAADLAVGVLGQADRARLGNTLEPRGNIDAVAHEVAVALLGDVAQMNADAKFDAFVERDPRIALDHGVLHFECAAHRVDDVAKLDDAAIAGALDDAAMMHGDCGIDQIAAHGAQSRQSSIFVRTREPAIADDVGDQYRCYFPCLAYGAPSRRPP